MSKVVDISKLIVKNSDPIHRIITPLARIGRVRICRRLMGNIADYAVGAQLNI